MVDHRQYAVRDAFDRALVAALEPHEVELVVLAGFMRMLGPAFLGRYGGRVINIHPALLPAFPGVHAQRQAAAYGVKLSGCTVHFVEAGVDSGPIIAQAAVPVRDDDDEAALAARILAEEHRLLPVGGARAGRGAGHRRRTPRSCQRELAVGRIAAQYVTGTFGAGSVVRSQGIVCGGEWIRTSTTSSFAGPSWRGWCRRRCSRGAGCACCCSATTPIDRASTPAASRCRARRRCCPRWSRSRSRACSPSSTASRSSAGARRSSAPGTRSRCRAAASTCWRSASRRGASSAREFPAEIDAIEAAIDRLVATSGLLDAPLGSELTLPPDGFWERREVARLESLLPPPGTDLLSPLPAGHPMRAAFAVPGAMSTALAPGDVGTVGEARAFDQARRGLHRFEGGYAGLCALLIGAAARRSPASGARKWCRSRS